MDETKLNKAREFCHEVGELAKRYGLPVFIVTDGASLTSNNGNPCIKFHREKQIEWERINGFDPDEDWGSSFEALEVNEKVIIRQANNDDRITIRNMTMDLDEYYCEVMPKFKETYDIEKRRQSYDFVNKLNIKDFYIMETSKKKVIGTIAKMSNHGEVTLLNFYVEPEFRGKGYGRMMLDKVISDMDETHCGLSVYEDNKKSVKFYNDYGFKYSRTEEAPEGKLIWLTYTKEI